jgi:hypothetical protein
MQVPELDHARHLDAMRRFLSQSLASFNENKLVGLLAEVELRAELSRLGLGDRLALGGWLARPRRRTGDDQHAVAMFPLLRGTGESEKCALERASPYLLPALQLHRAGMSAHLCVGLVPDDLSRSPVTWRSFSIEGSAALLFKPSRFPEGLDGFEPRDRRYNFLRYSADSSVIPPHAVAQEFAKESCRIMFQEKWMCELTDFDGIFFGGNRTYPVEVKVKSVAEDKSTGEYFGLDIGPFVKLAFFNVRDAALDGLFIVKETRSDEARTHAGWWMITFRRLAQVASWQPRAGGRGMIGGTSSTVMIPKWAFSPMTSDTLAAL